MLIEGSTCPGAGRLPKVRCPTRELTTAIVDGTTNPAPPPQAGRQYHQIVWLPDDDGSGSAPRKRGDQSAPTGGTSDAGSSTGDVGGAVCVGSLITSIFVL